MDNKTKFDSLFKNILVGSKVKDIQGNDGFVKLIKIKSNYYSKALTKINEKIEELSKNDNSFKNEIYGRLYNFFSTFISPSGSVYYVYAPVNKTTYEEIYQNDEDTTLFWRTKDLYYVKTDIIPKPVDIKLKNDFIIHFNLSKLDTKRANEKKEFVYELGSINKSHKRITLQVNYKEGRIDRDENIEGIYEKIKREVELDFDDFKNVVATFERQSEEDLFINKNAKDFLTRQLDIWVYKYLYHGKNEWSESRIKQIQSIKEVALLVIDLISAFEDELVKIWNKPKFVRNSNYVITLDRIAEKNVKLIEKILDHKNFDKQFEEWKQLGIIEDNFSKKQIFNTTLTGKQLNEKYKFLPIDTKYFNDLKLEILGLFDDLDESLDGWLIHSENYQALNTILPKFEEKVQTIYIDPPYNTGSDEFIYKDKFQNASWLTMLENRLNISKLLMTKEGNFFISIGDTLKSNIRIHSESRLGLLCDKIFGENNLVANFVRKSGIAPRQDIKYIANYHDYVLCYSKNIDTAKINRKEADNSRLTYTDEYVKERGSFDLNQLDRGSKNYSESLDYPIIIEKEKLITVFEDKKFNKIPAPEKIEIWAGGDPKDKRWIFTWSKEKVKWGIQNDFIVFKKINSKWKIYYKEYKLVDNTNKPRERTNPYDSLILDYQNEQGTSEIDNLFDKRIFEYPKPSELIKYLLKIGSDRHSLILDFFAGSGTTAQAVMQLNKEDSGKRKFILVEMADYFNTAIIPRIKKVAYSFNWAEGKPQDTDGIGIFFKYFDLEQYEEALKNAVYSNTDILEFKNMKDEDYFFKYMFFKDPKMLDVVMIENNKLVVNQETLSKIYDNIDIAETISNVTGWHIKKIGKDKITYFDEDDEVEKVVDINNIDYRLVKALIWW